MQAIRMTCLSLSITIATAVTAAPAAAAPCAERFPFVCLFGPEADAMRAATAPAIEPEPAQKPQRRLLARKSPRLPLQAKHTPSARPATPAPLTEATFRHEGEAPLGPRFGPGRAFAMSIRLASPMQEQMRPPSSACVVEQTFNDLFRVGPEDDSNKVAALELGHKRALLMVAVKTGTIEAGDETLELAAATGASAAAETQIK